MAGLAIQRLPEQSGAGYCVVSEAGASVYSASKVARDEYPEVEITYLGAVSIAQRLRNPLSEVASYSSFHF